MNTPNKIANNNSSLDYRAAFGLVLKYWYLYLISFAIAIPIGKVYLKYVKPVYNIKTTVLIKDKKNKQIVDDILAEYKLETDRNIFNEIEILKSYRLIEKTIQSLDFGVSYFAKGNIRELEIYKKSPYEVQLDTTFHNPINTKLSINFEGDSNYTISYKGVGNFDGVLGEHLKNDYLSLTIYKTSYFHGSTPDGNPELYFIVNDPEQLVNKYANSLNIELASKNTSIIAISLNSEVYPKDIDFLKKHTETYLSDELENKNRVITNTLNFIDDLLIEISDSLRGAERQLESFRKDQKVDIESASLSVFDQIKELEKERAILLVKDRYYRYLQDYIANNHDISQIVAPSLMGIDEPMLNNLVNELYKLHSDKASLGFNAKDKNPTYAMLDLKVKNAKKGLVENIRNVLVSSEIMLDDNNSRLQQARAIVRMLPGKEMSLTKIKRKFNLNDNIYNYLLQKRTDASITKAANTADNMVVNSAYLTGRVSPNEKKTNLICIMLALLLPSAFIAYKIYFSNKINSKESIMYRTNIPVLGVIEHYTGRASYPLIESPKSSFSESVRALRVNLKYLATQKKSKIIGVTSTVSGEGKTFFALNLASSIAITNAKVLVIGADMRKPKLHINLNLSNEVGLSTYLINATNMEQIIFKTDIPNLDFIPAGPVPPNPIEILESQRLAELIEYVAQRYDYIIIDAAPIGLVADYYVLAKYMDANLYMIRYNYTATSMVSELDKLYAEDKLKDLFIVFNDLSHSSIYGYSYGYGYGGYTYGNNGYFDRPERNRFVASIAKLFTFFSKK